MISMNERIRKLLQSDVQLAVGCTEPVAIGFLAKEVRKGMDFDLQSVLLRVSKNMYKNGKSVTIPGTRETGLDLAAAIGLIRVHPGEGLMIFNDLAEDELAAAKKLLHSGAISMELAPDSPEVFAEITVLGEHNRIQARLAYGHDNLVYMEKDGRVVYRQEERSSENETQWHELNLSYLMDFVETFPAEALSFIEEGIRYNFAAASEGLSNPYGLSAGAKLKALLEKKGICQDVSMKARILTAAAADMRMGGGLCPIMTSGGSGNQGIGVVIPIAVVAEQEGISDEQRNRGILFGHLMNELVKLHSGKLSGMCGCAIGSGVGAAGGIAWMLGGSEKEISAACNYMFADVAGMLCDGAKDTCALKLSTCAQEAILAAYLSVEGLTLRPSVGVVGENLDATIRNIGHLSKEGFSVVDQKMLEVIQVRE